MPSRTTLSDQETPTRVLIVDDNEAILSRVASVLTPYCVVAGVARGGRAALEAAETLQPDVIVLDISMPDMNGLEVARALHDSGSKAAVVFLTVQNEEEIIHAASATGALGYVAKPRLISDLMFAVREARAGRTFHSPAR